VSNGITVKVGGENFEHGSTLAALFSYWPYISVSNFMCYNIIVVFVKKRN